MPAKTPWTIRESPWLTEIDLPSSEHLPRLIEEVFLLWPTYVWRGQRCSNWKLLPTIARRARAMAPGRVADHLTDFKTATLGRLPETPSSDDEWWALGQHHGLATPLLDWTSSPFVGAYFAYIGQGRPQTRKRALWGISRAGILQCSRDIQRDWERSRRPGPAPVVRILRHGLFAGNKRQISQSGLFTMAPDGLDLEQWSRRHAARFLPDDMLLIKILLPDADRAHCLRMLDRMSINHHSLFPDVDGAARYCNLMLEIDRYH